MLQKHEYVECGYCEYLGKRKRSYAGRDLSKDGFKNTLWLEVLFREAFPLLLHAIGGEQEAWVMESPLKYFSIPLLSFSLPLVIATLKT